MYNDNNDRLKEIVGKLSPDEGRYICRIVHSDPFKDSYSILLIIYVFILGVFLLWPFDFLSAVKNDASWIKNSNGLEFLKTGQAISRTSPRVFFNRLVTDSSITIELWLKTGDINQAGPARIFSYSKTNGLCNFVVAQAWDKLIVRLRTTKTSLTGTSPSLVIPDTFSSRSLTHMVIVYDLSGQRVYINGKLKARSNVLKGDFSNWDPSCRLVIGNEVTGDAPWKGKIYYTAVYNRALTEQEIRRNYHLGLPPKSNTDPAVFLRKSGEKDTAFKTKGLLLRYLFDERNGEVIHNSGSDLSRVNLFIPEYISHGNRPFLAISSDYWYSKLQFSDIILNILIFIPLGILIHGLLRTSYGLTLKISLTSLLAGTLFSIGVESLQHFSMTRDSSLIDVFTNMTGTAIGIIMDRCYCLYLNHQAKRLQMLLYDRKE